MVLLAYISFFLLSGPHFFTQIYTYSPERFDWPISRNQLPKLPHMKDLYCYPFTGTFCVAAEWTGSVREKLIATPLLPVHTGAAQLTDLNRAGAAWQLKMLEAQWPVYLGLQQGQTASFGVFALRAHILWYSSCCKFFIKILTFYC